MLRGMKVEKAGGLRCSGAADMQSETETMYFVCSGCPTSNSMRLKNLQIYENICIAKLFKRIADVDDVVYLASQLQRIVKVQTHRLTVGFLHYLSSCQYGLSPYCMMGWFYKTRGQDLAVYL